MKKNIFKGIFILLCLGCIYFLNKSEDSTIDDLSFKNIEALAQGEGDQGNIVCYGTGSIDCRQYKVEEIYTGLSLDIE